MKNRKILIVCKNLPPIKGGMEKLSLKLIESLSQKYSCVVIGPEISKQYVEKHAEFIGCKSNNLIIFFMQCLIKALVKSIYVKFDIHLATSGLMSPIIKVASFINRSFTITYIHGLDIVVDNFIYKKCFIPFIKSSNIIIANSTNTSQLIKRIGYKCENIAVINPGVEIPKLPVCNGQFKKKYSLENKQIILTVGRLVERKGIAEFIENVLPKIVNKFPSSMLVIIGDEAKNALKNENSVKNKILKSVNYNKLYGNVLIINEVSDSVLSEAYKDSNLFVFPLKETSGDIEGFGMVVAEAGAHGLMSIAFNVGGVEDAIVQGKTGYLIQPNNYNSMSNKITKLLLEEESYESKLKCQSHARKYSWDRFDSQMLELIESIT